MYVSRDICIRIYLGGSPINIHMYIRIYLGGSPINIHMYIEIYFFSHTSLDICIRIYLGGLHVHDTTMHRAVVESSYDKIIKL